MQYEPKPTEPMRKYILYFFAFLAITQTSNAQTVKNVQALAQKNSVIITYDLVASNPDQKFEVEIRSSINNYTTALNEVSGDVGPDQTPGIGKTITWAAIKEQGNFSGSVTFEISALLTFSPLTITNPTTGSSAKLGKSLDVKWQGGDRGRNLKMAILQGNNTVTEIPSVGSTGSYNWVVPKTLSKGDNYQIKLFDPTKPKTAAMSAEFQLKKTSILIYVIPAAVLLGVGAAVLLGGGGDGGSDPVDCATNPTHPDCVTGTIGTELATPPPPPGGGN
ncbi:MAG: hypothetical protein DRI71_01780 [Bacteroidetes bacterium]|nr:MAG: hypothetical protein DRI71_01780 [Bacteroidota bacterium]